MKLKPKGSNQKDEMKKKYPSLWGESKWYKQKRFSITEFIWVIALWSTLIWVLFV